MGICPDCKRARCGLLLGKQADHWPGRSKAVKLAPNRPPRIGITSEQVAPAISIAFMSPGVAPTVA